MMKLEPKEKKKDSDTVYQKVMETSEAAKARAKNVCGMLQRVIDGCPQKTN